MAPGSKVGLFGLHLLTPASRLVLVEGEINAMSIDQAAHGEGITAISFGSEGNFKSARTMLNGTGHERQEVAIWMDNPEKLGQALAYLNLPGTRGFTGLGGQDANDMLVASGADSLRNYVLDAFR